MMIGFGDAYPNRTLSFIAFLLTVLVTEACMVNTPTAKPRFIPFEAFLQETQKADLKDFVGQKGTKVSDPAEFARMKKHIVRMYEGVKVKNSFSFDKSNHVDCIDINTQPGLTKSGEKLTLQKPPPAMNLKIDENTAQANPVPDMLTRDKKDVHGNPMFCEKGYIPMRRITLDEMVRFPTLEDYFNKYGVRGTKGDPTPDKK